MQFQHWQSIPDPPLLHVGLAVLQAITSVGFVTFISVEAKSECESTKNRPVFLGLNFTDFLGAVSRSPMLWSCWQGGEGTLQAKSCACDYLRTHWELLCLSILFLPLSSCSVTDQVTLYSLFDWKVRFVSCPVITWLILCSHWSELTSFCVAVAWKACSHIQRMVSSRQLQVRSVLKLDLWLPDQPPLFK